MFSTLSSFLPPVLQLGGTQDKSSRPNVEPVSDITHTPLVASPASTDHGHEVSDGQKSATENEPSVKKKKERTHEVHKPYSCNNRHRANFPIFFCPQIVGILLKCLHYCNAISTLFVCLCVYRTVVHRGETPTSEIQSPPQSPSPTRATVVSSTLTPFISLLRPPYVAPSDFSGLELVLSRHPAYPYNLKPL